MATPSVSQNFGVPATADPVEAPPIPEMSTADLWAELIKRKTDALKENLEEGVRPPLHGSREDFQERLLAMAREALGIMRNSRDPAQSWLAEQILAHITTMAGIWLTPPPRLRRGARDAAPRP